MLDSPHQSGSRMGYSTTLCSVDLDTVKRAIRDHDPELIAHFRGALQARLAKATRRKFIRVIRDEEGMFHVDGVRMTKDEFQRETARSRWRRARIMVFVQKTKQEKRGWRLGTAALHEVLALMPPRIETAIPCFTESQLWSVHDDDELPEELAAVAILQNEIPDPDSYDCSSIGYGFQRICEHLSHHKVTIRGKCLLSHLNLKTKITKPRSPIKLPHEFDSPVIGYLTTKEVQTEHRTFSRSTIPISDDRYLTRDRSDFLKILEQAANDNLAVVGFYA